MELAIEADGERKALQAELEAVLEKALTAPSPRPRYPVGIGPAVQMALLPKLPTRLRDLLLSKMFGQR